MRVLFACTGGNGHFLPCLPIARALHDRGHQVRFGCQRAMQNTVRATGFPAVDTGGRTLLASGVRGPLVPLDRLREELVIRNGFAGRTATERAPRLIALARQWRADVIVRDEVDFGAAIAAEALGLPHVEVIVLAAGGLIRPDLVAGPLDLLRADFGLPPDPLLRGLHGHLTVAPLPPSFRSPDDPLPPDAAHIKPAVLARSGNESARGDLTDWLDSRGDRPTISFSLGTVFNQEAGDLFVRVVSGLRTLDANIVVAVGREIDPLELGQQSDNVRVERFIPQSVLLPRCALVVSHGGSGTVISALAFGLPLVLLPMGADQPLNGDRCCALGLAEVLDPVTATGHDIARAAARMLTSKSHRQAAQRTQREIAGLPEAATLGPLIENLVAG